MVAIVGCVKEIKDNEYRVGLVPGGAKALTDAGHRVLIQAGAVKQAQGVPAVALDEVLAAL